MSSKLDWSERYCLEKFLPLLTKYHLQENVPNRSIQPVEIKKKRNPKGVPSFEVLWNDIDGQYEALIPDDQFEEGEDVLSPWTSIERQDLMRQYYPNLVEKYEESIKKPTKPKKSKGRKKVANHEEVKDKPKRKYNRKPKQLKDVAISSLNESLKNLSLINKELNSSKSNVSISVNRLKRKLKNNTKCKTKNTIDGYLQPRKKRKSSKLMQSLSNSFKNISILHNEPRNFKHSDAADSDEDIARESEHLLSMFNMSEEKINEIDLSDIVDNIVARAPAVTTAKVDNNFVKLIFENKQLARKSILSKRFHQNNSSTPKSSPVRKESQVTNAISKTNNTSYFFDKITDQCDVFEMSMEYNHKIAAINLDCDATLDYSLRYDCM